jgi:hypothetical protein
LDFKEIEKLNADELNGLISFAKELLKKKDNEVKVFFAQLKKDLEFSRNELYENYISWAKENNLNIKDKQIFNRYANIYIDEYSIKMKKRIKEKKEKNNTGGDITSKNEV